MSGHGARREKEHHRHLDQPDQIPILVSGRGACRQAALPVLRAGRGGYDGAVGGLFGPDSGLSGAGRGWRLIPAAKPELAPSHHNIITSGSKKFVKNFPTPPIPLIGTLVKPKFVSVSHNLKGDVMML